jgi:hypothetical protein
MRTLSQARLRTSFRPDDPLFETDRLRVRTASMTFFDHISGLPEEQQKVVDDILDHAFTHHDFGVLFDGLEFLKFNRATAESIVSVVSTAASFMTAIGAIVGAVEAAGKVFEFLGITDAGGVDIEEKLREIGAKVDEIYGYLEREAINDIYKRAKALRYDVEWIRGAIATAAGSQSPAHLEGLDRRTDLLDKLIRDMLIPESGNVPFSRITYSQASNPNALWFSLSGTPYLKQANGDETKKLTGLSSPVWDPGHYIDTLAAAIRLRIAAATSLEPLYRSTGSRRKDLEMLVPLMRKFLDHWHGAIMVADPEACVMTDGTLALYNKESFDWPGILVGAVCPVTGISSLRLFDAFPKTSSRNWSPFASGDMPDKFKAADPAQAVHDAYLRHVQLVDQVKRVCGLRDFENLYRELRDVAGPPKPTESVRFAAVRRVPAPHGPFGVTPLVLPIPATLDLGNLRRFSPDPNKTYPATRHFTSGSKVLTLRLARRGVQSRTQLGYKLRIDQEIIDLIAWQPQPAPEVELVWFPTTPIERDLHLRKKVYDCVQSRHLTAAEEEGFDLSGDTGTAQRLLVNERTANVSAKVRIEFNPLPAGEPNPFLGEVKVFIQAVDPVHQPDAYLLDIDIFETHMAHVGPPPIQEEVLVEGHTLHVVPSYLVAGKDFFDDYWDAYLRMLRARTGALLEASRRKFDLADVPHTVDPSPKFSTVLTASSVELNTQLFEVLERDAGIAAEIERHMLPLMQKG